MTRPIAPLSRPLSSEASVRPATMDSAKTKSEKYSHGPNWSANAASGPVAPTRKNAPSSPPMNDAQVPSQMRPAGLAPARHREAVERRRHRRRLAGNAEQARGDEAARLAAHVDADHRGEARERVQAEGERQHDDDRHRDGHAGQHAADQPDRGADDERHEVLELEDLAEAREERAEHRSEPGQAPARQQHVQVRLEEVVGDQHAAEGAGERRPPRPGRCAADRAWPAARPRRARSPRGSRPGAGGTRRP